MIVALALAAALAAEPSPAVPPVPAEQEPAVIETIEETTVGDLNGVRVPMGNVIEDDYTLPDGTVARGLVCALALESGPLWVGAGSVVEVGGATWRVVSVKRPPGERGEVTLERERAP